MKPVQHEMLNKDGSVTKFTAVPFMTLEEARIEGPQKISDPNFIAAKIDKAIKKAGK